MFWRGPARFRGDQRSGTIDGALLTPSFWHFCGNFRSVCGPLHNHCAEAGTKNEPDMFSVPIQKKGRKIGPHVSNKDLVDFVFEGFNSTLNKTKQHTHSIRYDPEEAFFGKKIAKSRNSCDASDRWGCLRTGMVTRCANRRSLGTYTKHSLIAIVVCVTFFFSTDEEESLRSRCFSGSKSRGTRH